MSSNNNLLLKPCSIKGCVCKFASFGAALEHLSIHYHCPECGMATGDYKTVSKEGYPCSICAEQILFGNRKKAKR